MENHSPVKVPHFQLKYKNHTLFKQAFERLVASRTILLPTQRQVASGTLLEITLFTDEAAPSNQNINRITVSGFCSKPASGGYICQIVTIPDNNLVPLPKAIPSVSQESKKTAQKLTKEKLSAEDNRWKARNELVSFWPKYGKIVTLTMCIVSIAMIIAISNKQLEKRLKIPDAWQSVVVESGVHEYTDLRIEGSAPKL